jgi:hypothetical protein
VARLLLLAVLATTLGCLKAGADPLEITITIPFVRGNPDPSVVTEVPVYAVGEDFLCYSATLTFGFDDERLALLDIENVGLPSGIVLWSEGDGVVTVTFAGIDPVVVSGHLVNLIVSWREGSGCGYLVLLQAAFYGEEVYVNLDSAHGGVCIARELDLGSPDAHGELDAIGESGDLARPRLVVTNPYRVGSAIALFAPEAHQAVDVVLYAADGRQVRTLHTGRVGSRGTTLTWNGRTDAGREAAAGIYYVLASSGQEPQIAKLLLIR